MKDIVIRRMYDLGWLSQAALTDPESTEKAAQQYAAFHGLSSMNDIEDHVHEPRICALPDIMPMGMSMCKWPDGDITWDIVSEINGLSKDQVKEGVTEALNRWKKVCGIRPVYTPNNPAARITIGSRRIDGAMGVLAESELPCGVVTRCRQWYDNGEPWKMFNGSGNGIDFIRVAMHELGHALGMGHIGAGNLLAPTYSRQIWEAQSGDISEMLARYGQPRPPEPTDPPPTNFEEYVIRVRGKMTIDGCRVTRLLSAE